MLVSSYTTVKFQGIDPWVQVSQLEGHKPSSIHCSSCLVKHIKPSQKSDFSNNNNHFILAQKLEEWPRSVSIYAVTVRLWLESPQRIPCSCLMPGLERLKPLGGERARALRSISSPPFSLFLSSHLLLFFLFLFFLFLFFTSLPFPTSLPPSLPSSSSHDLSTWQLQDTQIS